MGEGVRSGGGIVGSVGGRVERVRRKEEWGGKVGSEGRRGRVRNRRGMRWGIEG